MQDQLLDTWRIHCRINLYILDAISADAFATARPAKGRSFDEMFAHIHNVRLMWLQSGAPELLAGLQKLEKDSPLDHNTLRIALQASGEAIATLLQQGIATGKIKGFKPHVTGFLGYLIAHEAYHHGEIGIALTQAGFPLDRKTAFGMWEWGVR